MLPKEQSIMNKFIGSSIIHSQNFYHSFPPNKPYKTDKNNLPQCGNFGNYFIHPIVYGDDHQLALLFTDDVVKVAIRLFSNLLLVWNLLITHMGCSLIGSQQAQKKLMVKPSVSGASSLIVPITTLWTLLSSHLAISCSMDSSAYLAGLSLLANHSVASTDKRGWVID